MTLAIVLALVICFTNFVKLTPCTQEGKDVKGHVWVAFDSVQSMTPIGGNCTELFFSGGGRRFVRETPEEIIKLQENRQDPN